MENKVRELTWPNGVQTWKRLFRYDRNNGGDQGDAGWIQGRHENRQTLVVPQGRLPEDVTEPFLPQKAATLEVPP